MSVPETLPRSRDLRGHRPGFSSNGPVAVDAPDAERPAPGAEGGEARQEQVWREDGPASRDRELPEKCNRNLAAWRARVMTGRHQRRRQLREGPAKAPAQPRTVGKAELVEVGAIPAGECAVDGGGEGSERMAPGGREAPAGPWRHCAKASGHLCRVNRTFVHGRGERSQTSSTDLNVPAAWRLRCHLTWGPAGSTQPRPTTIAS